MKILDKQNTNPTNSRLISKFLIMEGIDNVGKGTQIKNIHEKCTERLFHTVHYSGLGFKTPEEHIDYSKDLYTDMFKMMYDAKCSARNFIFDRSHLGEAVYAPLYRNYDGNYVFDIEEKNLGELDDNLFLIVLINDAETVIKRDDGLSFSTDITDKRREIDYFIEAYFKSNIKNKILIKCEDSSIEEINKEIMDFIQE